jgi:metal-responsive CopG/Arc/MetJ family transcriptional regulator
MKTIQLTIDEPLLERVDCAAREQHSARSEFIRTALERELRRLREEEVGRQYEESYRKQPMTAEEIEELAEWQAIQAWPDDDEEW